MSVALEIIKFIAPGRWIDVDVAKSKRDANIMQIEWKKKKIIRQLCIYWIACMYRIFMHTSVVKLDLKTHSLG